MNNGISAPRRSSTGFRDERDVSRESVSAQTSRYNILWSNQQVLRPALYMRTPKPQVSRRFIDKDPKARLAAQVLERAITHCVESYDFRRRRKAGPRRLSAHGPRHGVGAVHPPFRAGR